MMVEGEESWEEANRREVPIHYLDTWGDQVLMVVVTGGIYLVVLVVTIICVWCVAGIRRFVMRMPDWDDF